jgi:hypothetical protein
MYTILQLASNYLVASARGQAWTCAFHLYQQQFCCLENWWDCNILVTATEKLPVLALSYKTVLPIPGNKIVDQLKLPVRAWPNVWTAMRFQYRNSWRQMSVRWLLLYLLHVSNIQLAKKLWRLSQVTVRKPGVSDLYEINKLYVKTATVQPPIRCVWRLNHWLDCSKGLYTLSIQLSDFTVWRHTWCKNWVKCAVLTGNSADLRNVLSSSISHTELRSSHNLPAETTMASSQGTWPSKLNKRETTLAFIVTWTLGHRK